MKPTAFAWVLVALVLFMSCKSLQKPVVITYPDPDNNAEFIHKLLQTRPDAFGEILNNPEPYRVQILYTRIDRNKDNEPSFTTYSYGLNDSLYFYPASTIKFPLSVMALHRLNELSVPGLNRETTMFTEAVRESQSRVYNDPNSSDGRPTIAQYIRKILLVSDNDASNRLYEFLGQDYIHQLAYRKGFPQTRILHRLAVAMPRLENRYSNPILFTDSSGKTIMALEGKLAVYDPPMQEVKLGRGYYSGSKLVNQPFDFTYKNRIPLNELHRYLQAVIFPETLPGEHRFNLKTDDLQFLWNYMSAWPADPKFPQYDPVEYPPNYQKFLLVGGKDTSWPEGVKIFSKSGQAYGFLTDMAYIIHPETGVEFMLSATIHCNSDGIYNDDNYDYETVGFSFMKELGQLIFDYEKQREKKHLPSFSRILSLKND